MSAIVRKIVFFTISPFSERDYKRFGIDILKANGFDVTILYLGYLIYGIKEKEQYFDNIKSIETYTHLKDYLSSIEHNSLVIKLFGLSSKLIFVEALLLKSNIKIVSVNQNSIPISFVSMNKVAKIKHYFRISSWRTFLEKIVFIYYRKKLKNPNYVLLGGEKSDILDKHTIKIWTHTLDYDIFLEDKSSSSEIKSARYAVYLDEYVPYHPDFKKVGLDKVYKSIASAYYEKMNDFFDRIEELYQLKVIIAAHPRSDYKKYKSVWKERKITYGKTKELVSQSEFCMMHASTSINFAILYQKPILFITLQELDPLYGNFIDGFSTEVKTKKLFIDTQFNKEEIDKFLNIDTVAYKKYQENYIKKSGTPKKNSWQIFSDFIKKENGEIKNV